MGDVVDLFGPKDNATFSPCRTWRYSLTRKWADGPTVAFVMLNPSTADETRNDPTVAKCVKFSKQWKYGEPRGVMALGTPRETEPIKFVSYGKLVVVNIFAYRATDPGEMKVAADPIGPEKRRGDHLRVRERRARRLRVG